MRPAVTPRDAFASVHPTCAWIQSGTDTRALRLFGRLGGRELDRIAETILERARSPREVLWIDFESVAHVDYRALPAFVRALARVRAGGVTIRITGLSRYVRSLFDVSGQGPAVRSMEWNPPRDPSSRSTAATTWGTAPASAASATDPAWH